MPAEIITTMTRVSDFMADLKSQNVAVKVGSGWATEEYNIPKELLRRASPWFEAALKDERFVEGRDSAINMPEDGQDAFEMFVYFAYHGYVTFDNTISDMESVSNQVILCCRTWTFAQKYLVPGLQNCVMHRACHILRSGSQDSVRALTAEAFASCWQAANEGSPLRDILADHAVATMDKAPMPDVEKHLAVCPGLIQALHKSEALLHDSPAGEFPRYNKPVRMSVLLQANVPAESTITAYGDRFLGEDIDCDDCGAGIPRAEINARCEFCKEENCLRSHRLGTNFYCQECVSEYV